MIPALERLPTAPRLVDREGYFVVHAPRQTGKTTVIRALAEELTTSGRYAALAFSCEGASAAGEDYGEVERMILSQVRRLASAMLPDELQPPPWPDAAKGDQLASALQAWSIACPRPLVLFFDEIDSLQGAGLVSVLRQLRAGFADRPETFPSSVILCGLKDVRDYKAASGGDPSRLASASPFNIKIASLRLGDFTSDEISELYAQHTAATGQVFEVDALDCVYELTKGQPWLVNALADEIIEELAIPPSEPVTVNHVVVAKERLIKARATHLDSLAAKLVEPRVARVIAPLIAGEVASGMDLEYNDDVAYLRDLGLIASDNPIRVANPIYREVILRVLSAGAEQQIAAEPASFVTDDGRLNLHLMLEKFRQWWIENDEILSVDSGYHEVAAQLILMAFLQRVVNGGGFIDREFHVGHRRVDILVRWPHTDADGNRRLQREALELKVRRPGRPDPLEEGLSQIDAYLERLGLDHGILAIFDRRPDAPPVTERTGLSTTTTPSGRQVTLLRG